MMFTIIMVAMEQFSLSSVGILFSEVACQRISIALQCHDLYILY
jgi:hypothetical protein